METKPVVNRLHLDQRRSLCIELKMHFAQVFRKLQWQLFARGLVSLKSCGLKVNICHSLDRSEPCVTQAKVGRGRESWCQICCLVCIAYGLILTVMADNTMLLLILALLKKKKKSQAFCDEITFW